jgi:SAM-dependent methyltransferase
VSEEIANAWNGQAQKWQHVGLPTRPTTEDGNMMLELASGSLRGAQTHIGVLGVTPEVVQLAWPNDANLHAFDLSADMIKSVWRPNSRLNCLVTQANWTDIPLPDSSFDCIVGDGIVTAAGSPEVVERVLAEICRVLKPEGKLILRCFIRPDNPEGTELVVQDALEARIQHFGTLKWRLAMALVGDDSQVSPRLVHAVFNQQFTDRSLLATSTGWHSSAIDTIDAYENMQGSFYFPRFDELIQVASEKLSLKRTLVGTYELAERCPTVELSRRDH